MEHVGNLNIHTFLNDVSVLETDIFVVFNIVADVERFSDTGGSHMNSLTIVAEK